jgi:hypothetical protein
MKAKSNVVSSPLEKYWAILFYKSKLVSDQAHFLTHYDSKFKNFQLSIPASSKVMFDEICIVGSDLITVVHTMHTPKTIILPVLNGHPYYIIDIKEQVHEG